LPLVTITSPLVPAVPTASCNEQGAVWLQALPDPPGAA
jgi:hypothetical protein